MNYFCGMVDRRKDLSHYHHKDPKHGKQDLNLRRNLAQVLLIEIEVAQ